MNIGDKVILRNADDLGLYGLVNDMVGWVNNIVVLPEGEFVLFNPDGMGKFFFVASNRLEVIIDPID